MKSRYKGQYGKVLCPECESEMRYDGTGVWHCTECNWILEDDELEDYAKFSDLLYDELWMPDTDGYGWSVDD